VDKDCTFTGAYFSGNGNWILSTNPNAAATNVSAPTAGNRWDILACGSGSFRVSGAFAPRVPLSAGEVIYWATNVLGVFQLLLEDDQIVS